MPPDRAVGANLHVAAHKHSVGIAVVTRQHRSGDTRSSKPRRFNINEKVRSFVSNRQQAPAGQIVETVAVGRAKRDSGMVLPTRGDF